MSACPCSSTLRLAILALFSLVLQVSWASAQDVLPASDVVEYRVSLAGLTIADASIAGQRDGKGYSLHALFRSAGIANVITSMDAVTDVNGTFASGGLLPDTYAQEFHRGKKGRRYDMRFEGGRVKELQVQPSRDKYPENWIAVTDDDLIGVSDPLSAVFRPLDGGACQSPVPVFDGEMRFDLILAPLGQKTLDVDNASLVTEACSVAFQPKSGFRKGRKDIETLKKEKAMEVWFARAERMQTWVPVRVIIPTRYGQLDIRAVRFAF